MVAEAGIHFLLRRVKQLVVHYLVDKSKFSRPRDGARACSHSFLPPNILVAPKMTTPQPDKTAMTMCSSFQLGMSVGASHALTFGGAPGSARIDRKGRIEDGKREVSPRGRAGNALRNWEVGSSPDSLARTCRHVPLGDVVHEPLRVVLERLLRLGAQTPGEKCSARHRFRLGSLSDSVARGLVSLCLSPLCDETPSLRREISNSDREAKVKEGGRERLGGLGLARGDLRAKARPLWKGGGCPGTTARVLWKKE